ncbi:PH domain-containing protein [Sphingomicrobium flavum]|uniref:PH domain-containing protein n=1 Tax=Sphingomicrobium flavum TaxID=1229164 RepID=UPI0021ADF2E2|nr:PH domain-containing protein [Sphingomicrobium flavum]
MNRYVRIIRPPWWSYLFRFFGWLICLFLLIVLTMTMINRPMTDGALGWLGSGLFGATLMFALTIITNTLPPYHVAVDADGVRINGLLHCRHIRWSEIREIQERFNYRLPGKHAFILVDGSNLPERNWEQLWLKGYPIAGYAGMSGPELVRYLRRRHREWKKRGR